MSLSFDYNNIYYSRDSLPSKEYSYHHHNQRQFPWGPLLCIDSSNPFNRTEMVWKEWIRPSVAIILLTHWPSLKSLCGPALNLTPKAFSPGPHLQILLKFHLSISIIPPFTDALTVQPRSTKPRSRLLIIFRHKSAILTRVFGAKSLAAWFGSWCRHSCKSFAQDWTWMCRKRYDHSAWCKKIKQPRSSAMSGPIKRWTESFNNTAPHELQLILMQPWPHGRVCVQPDHSRSRPSHHHRKTTVVFVRGAVKFAQCGK